MPLKIDLKAHSLPGKRKALIMRHEDVGAVAPPHGHAILGLAQIGDAGGKPQGNGRERDGECEGGEVGQHAMAKIVGFIALALIAGEIVGLGGLGLGFPAPGQLAVFGALTAMRCESGARPEYEHAVLVIRLYGPLGLHCCQLRNMLRHNLACG
jgi:hypothetical protein